MLYIYIIYIMWIYIYTCYIYIYMLYIYICYIYICVFYPSCKIGRRADMTFLDRTYGWRTTELTSFATQQQVPGFRSSLQGWHKTAHHSRPRDWNPTFTAVGNNEKHGVKNERLFMTLHRIDMNWPTRKTTNHKQPAHHWFADGSSQYLYHSVHAAPKWMWYCITSEIWSFSGSLAEYQ